MKKLDESKRYKLSDASDEQIQQVLEYLKTTNTSWRTLTKKGELICVYGAWCREESGFYDCCITTLFEEDVLKIGDTFEKDGFVCVVKEKIKDHILVGDWIRNDRNMFFKYEKWMLNSPLWVKITDQEFIRQLEKYSR